jgi:S1-C subfamily serine protease
MRCPAIYLICGFLMALTMPSVRGDELADKGRQIFKKNQHAVVTVQAVIKLRMSMPGMGGDASEFKQDVTGTVIDPSGLTVLALSACDPGDMLQSLMTSLSGDGGSRFKMDAELNDVKILLDDGTELPSEVVLRDKDLDLAFIRPKTKPATPMTALDFSKNGKVEVLDQVITLNRLGNAAGRAYAASVERITAVVQKPRLFYVPGTDPSSTALGSPAFTIEGNVLGVFVMRSLKDKGSAGMSVFSSRPDSLTAIILPAEDILKAAKQVPEMKGAEEKKETLKELKEPEVKK